MASLRRKLDWSKVRGPKMFAVLFIATAGGAGLLPLAPGTWGTFVGIPIAYFSQDWPLGARLALWLGLLALGTWAAALFDQAMGSADNQNIVIDEVVGLGITAWTIQSGSGWRDWLAAFLLFRLFDMWKPYPIRSLDRWSHILSKDRPYGKWLAGFGVMADDLLAAIYALIVMILLQHSGVL